VLPSTAKRFFLDGRATVRGWAEYKRRSGRFPWIAILIHILNWVVVVSGIVLLIWRAGQSRWSQSKLLGVLLLVGLPYAIFWYWLSNKVNLNQIRSSKRLRNS
jgi:uncharacterized membrane protein SirB2